MTARRHPLLQSLRGGRGDAAIITVFLTLIVLLLSAIALTVIVIGNVRGTLDIVVSSQALYAADTAVEFGRTHFAWVIDFDGDNNFCTVKDDADFDVPGASFDVIVTGDPAPATFAGPPSGNEDANCPTLTQVKVPPGDPNHRELCITAFGDTRNKSIRRRVDFDTNEAICRGS